MTVFDAPDQPVYLRLRAILVALILDGHHGDGDQLPSVRAFAAEHGANPLTVAKAYQSLQDDGYVAVRRGVGMFVADGAADHLRDTERAHFLSNGWPRIRAHMARIGLDPSQLPNKLTECV
jgi:GntR family transcriptional regulator